MTTSAPATNPPSAYEAAKTRAAFADFSDRSTLRLTGADRIKLLHNLSTNDLLKLPVNAGCELFLLDAKGRILDYLVAFNGPDALWLDAEPGRAESIVRHLDRYVIREDVQFEIATSRLGILSVFGPEAAGVVGELFRVDLSDRANLSMIAAELDGREVVVRRLDRAVVPTFEALTAADAMQALTRRLAGVVPELTTADVQLLRIEAGIPRMGVDIEEGCLAQEIGRDNQAISFTKGCYLGQETVARLDALGHVNRLLRGLVFEGFPPVAAGKQIFLGDKLVGHVTSTAASTARGQTLALAMIRTAGIDPGKKLEVAGDPLVPAVVHALPFI